MAEAFVSVLVEQLASYIFQETKQEVKLLVGVEEEVQNLTSNLQAIGSVLEDAERRQVKEDTVKQWLRKLKDVTYDIDDVLDMWNSVMLKMQIKRDEKALRPIRKVCSFFFSTWFCCMRVTLRHNIAFKIKQINKRLNVVAKEKCDFNFTLIEGNKELQRQMTASVIDVSEVHGRYEEKSTIINMLLDESSLGPTLRIISIVGMAGIGKTTLAQLVYNDDTVNAHFQTKIWVCVSDPFDEIRIAKAILEVLLKVEAPKFNELESLLQCMRDSIKDKKFLLVLDDVWTEDFKKFEQLKNSLKCGSPKSKILVTTRKETVAKTMGTTDMFPLGQLSNEECWSLFSQVAFFGRSNEERKNLKDIGQKIVDKCKGLPLAAKVIGSLLCFKNTREEWESVLDSEVWELEEAEKSLFPLMLLSYYDLSSTMRRCFSYCAIFPKDYEIKKDKLIKLWMAQDYLRETPNKDMEMVGKECFSNLAMRSFFQDIKENGDNRGITCKMHDIVHDFAKYVTENDCFVMEVHSPTESRVDSPLVEAHHSMMMLAETVSIPTSIYNVKNLRSLIVESKDLPIISAALPKLFDQLTCLRTLDLCKPPNYLKSSLKELPREVGKLIHLRYLNLAHNEELEKLPNTVSDLCNLQSLNLDFCERLKELPRGLGNLINLRHLELYRTGDLGFMPRGMYRLSTLRTLGKFVVSSDGNANESSTLEDLKNLNHLQGYLEIRWLGKLRDVSEAKKAQLDKKKHLLHLFLDFGEEEREGRMTNDQQVIEALQPPPNLEQLSIVEYRGKRFPPNWMMPLTNLKKLQIGWCNNCELLPPLGKLLSLESLSIGIVQKEGYDLGGGMSSLKRVGNEFLGTETDYDKNYNNEGPSNRDEAETSLSSVIAFPKLKQLHFSGILRWEEWDCGITRRTIRIMPCLCDLKIVDCPKLKALPDHLIQMTSLKKLHIGGCPLLSKCCKPKKGDDWHKISHIPYIYLDGNYVQQDGELETWFQNSAGNWVLADYL